MKLAKATQADLDMAMELCGVLEAVTGPRPSMPEALADPEEAGAADYFDAQDPRQAMQVLDHLLALTDRASLSRVVYGCAVLLDPKNRCVDPSTPTLEHHPDAKAGLAAKQARPLVEWTQAQGPVLWWRFPVEDAPWCGTPLATDWPGYHTHWTPLIVPADPSQPRP